MYSNFLCCRGILLFFFVLIWASPVLAGSPYIVLKGADTVRVEMGYRYTEPGFTAYGSTGMNLTPNVTRVSSNPKSFTLTGPELIPGSYSIAYNLTDSQGLKAPTQYRYVIVLKDTMRPSLIVAAPDTTFVQVNAKSTGYVTLPKVYVSEDLIDGTLPDTITPANIPINKLDTVLVVYSTSDLSNNRTKVYRWIIVYDNVPPKITLNRVNDTAYFGAVYKESTTFTDNYYATSSLKITKSGTYYKRFPTGMPDTFGTYTIIYTAEDSSGNVSAATLYITVKDTFKPRIILKGKTNDTLQVLKTYSDQGVQVSDKYYSISELTISKGGTFYSAFPTGKATTLGTYDITYFVKNPSGITTSVRRNIIVVDTMKPHIQLNGRLHDSVQVTDVYADQGVKVSDPYYVAQSLTVTRSGSFYTSFPSGKASILGSYTIVYTVKNLSGDFASITRFVKVIDSIRPVITLKGLLSDSTCPHVAYTDAGYTAADMYYSAAELKIDTLSFYDSDKNTASGTYYVQYRVTNPSNLFSLSQKRAVFVRQSTDISCKNSISEGSRLEKYVKIYPNPNTGQFSIYADLEGYRKPVYISISDLLGHTVAVINSGSLMQTTFTVDMSGRPAGIYVINIATGNERLSKEIVVTR